MKIKLNTEWIKLYGMVVGALLVASVVVGFGIKYAWDNQPTQPYIKQVCVDYESERVYEYGYKSDGTYGMRWRTKNTCVERAYKCFIPRRNEGPDNCNHLSIPN